MPITNNQEAVMSNSIPAQHPAVVLRSQYRQLRSLLAVLVVAVVGLSTTVVVLTVDDQTATTATTTHVPTAQLGDPFAGPHAADPRGRPAGRERHRGLDLPGRKPFLPDAERPVPEPGGAAPPAGRNRREQGRDRHLAARRAPPRLTRRLDGLCRSCRRTPPLPRTARRARRPGTARTGRPSASCPPRKSPPPSATSAREAPSSRSTERPGPTPGRSPFVAGSPNRVLSNRAAPGILGGRCRRRTWKS